MNIVILDDYQDAVRKLNCSQKLEPYAAKVYTNTVKGTGQLAIRLKDADIIVLIKDRTSIQRSLIEKLPKLKLIVQAGEIGRHIDINSCTERGICIAEGTESSTATAELTWALVMSSMRRLPQYISNLKHGVWQQSGLKSLSMPSNFGLGMTLSGKTLGIWGYGSVGRQVAGFGRAFGMRVQVWGSNTSKELAQRDGQIICDTKDQLFETSDILSLHLRLSDSTRHIVTSDDLAKMKTTALLVNTSSAEIIEAESLIGALNRGQPGMAAVDVFESEPILQGQALLRLENCVCTPHIGYVEKDNFEKMFSQAFDSVLSFIKGTPSNIINPEALQVRR